MSLVRLPWGQAVEPCFPSIRKLIQLRVALLHFSGVCVYTCACALHVLSPNLPLSHPACSHRVLVARDVACVATHCVLHVRLLTMHLNLAHAVHAVPKGFYCPANNSNASGIKCPEGYSCKGGSAGPDMPCKTLPGYYCNASLTNSTTICPTGSFCVDGEIFPCNVPEGRYCPPETSTPNGSVCVEGHYCRGYQEDMVPCSALPAGNFCAEGSVDANGTPCVPGSYCPGGNNGRQLCAQGTYGTGSSFVSAEDCSSCGQGTFSSTG